MATPRSRPLALRPVKSLVLLLALGFLAEASALVPLEKFAMVSVMSDARLSPDGKSFAFMQESGGGNSLKIVNLETRKTSAVDPGLTSGGWRKEIAEFRWISDRRLSFVTTVFGGLGYTGVGAVDRDGTNWRIYSGPEANEASDHPLQATQIIHAFGDAEQSVLMLDARSGYGKDLLFKNVIKISTMTGVRHTVVENPGNVIGWVVDRHGLVRAGVTREGMRYGVILRDREGAPWRTPPLLDEKLGAVELLGFDHDGRRLLVAANSERNRRAVYYYDPAEGKLGDLVAGHPEYDIVPEFGAPRVDGVALTGPIYSELAQATVGIRYVTDRPQVAWFDSGLAGIQGAIDLTLPKTVNVITSRSRDEKQFLVLAFSDRDPGTYYLLDLQSGQPVFTRLAAQVPDFPVDRMAPMRSIKYPARDGLEIHGYLTLPLGDRKTGLPLVVMPHGGPNVRDVWGYDAMVQFLASRGYAVLQMNYRGSPGYGTEFLEKGRRQIGRGIQTDIDDGTRWAIDQGIADPARVAILGASYGGYSALFALGNSPKLYRCGVSIAGVSDWAEIFRERKGEEYRFAFEYFKEWIGDPATDVDFLASISPVHFADKIVAPLLIVHGKDDKIVPARQSRRLAGALEKAGHKPQTLFVSNEGHSFRDERNWVKLFREIEGFLAKNLLAPASAR